MSEFALWRRLNAAGHDAARLSQNQYGWLLQGAAVFEHKGTPACLEYEVQADSRWQSRRATIRGFANGQPLVHKIVRTPKSWYLDGKLMKGLHHLRDIDFGFTPATNVLQLRRVALSPGQECELAVAWFDLAETELTELRQKYRSIDPRSYDYAAPSVGYVGRLAMLQNGFIKTYPGLWEAAGTAANR